VSVRVQPSTWQGALTGEAKTVGDLWITGLEWEATQDASLVHGLRLISNDTRIRQWTGVPTLWAAGRG